VSGAEEHTHDGSNAAAFDEYWLFLPDLEAINKRLLPPRVPALLAC
jgi:hypothetical protein